MKDLKNKYSRTLLAAPIIALLAMPMAAQAINESSPRVSFKIGTAPALNPDRQQRRESIMVGIEYSRPFWKGEFFATAEWREFMTVQYREDSIYSPFVWGTAEYTAKTGYAPTSDINPQGEKGYITAFTRRPENVPSPGLISSDMRFDSVDMRRAVLDGVTAKLAYRYRTDSLPLVGSLGLQGGLTLSFLRAWEYADGAIHVLSSRTYSQNQLSTANWPQANSVHATLGSLDQFGRIYNEYFRKQESDTKLLPGAFIGVRKLFTDTLFCELNLTVLGHSDVNYIPYSYTGQDPHIATSNKTKTVIEFVAGMRF